ncbi:TPA: hypothetical protein DEP34_02095 [Candidatus Uhrbacteria bacterium]|uniref:Uncharacterized protein n=2 Tax=Candidatus Uhriibacteriota TaxID=1752732 RepID=A0A0G1Q776_9BACT|nr:MAG: hypothetical protein UX45_C0014G0013 [Candidatus Uhrbacteria bacterium GW2011_GWF2_46_218]KKU40911.1 MAG: hypothetical protein UX57_C0008G0023 [Candidatus Uhrbacteria bacterium GW2011_GWE2_46_68]HBK33975.1 hypothetical protein [Candidatus Uhrbacteria bacterium]HCB19153.1 hypothetical protein [Candidatus Uhrbacteria bacterium]
MELSKRVKKILVFILMLLIVLLLILYLVRIWSSVPSPLGSPVVEQQEDQVEESVIDKEAVSEQQEAAKEVNVRTVVKTFAERFGSYSNEANFANITDVLPMMTEAYATQTQSAIDSWTASDVYYAVTTRVLTMEITIDEEAGTAQAIVSTQREEARGDVQNISVSYQELVLDLTRVSGSWFVDNATWR